MRRLLLLPTLLLAACATRPQPQPVAETPPPVQTPRTTRVLLGLTANQLMAQFGRPALQVREGSSLKLQFRARQCVLDAYLYSQGGAMRVTHVDARTTAGVDTDQAACILALEEPS
jgi:hypothetical protein